MDPGKKKRKCLVSRGELKGRVSNVETGSPLSPSRVSVLENLLGGFKNLS